MVRWEYVTVLSVSDASVKLGWGVALSAAWQVEGRVTAPKGWPTLCVACREVFRKKKNTTAYCVVSPCLVLKGTGKPPSGAAGAFPIPTAVRSHPLSWHPCPC